MDFYGNYYGGVVNPTPSTFKYNGEYPSYMQNPGTVNSYNPYYNYMQYYQTQDKYQVYQQAYVSGEMPLSDYIGYNNGGIKPFNTGYGSMMRNSNDWYSNAATYISNQQQAYKTYNEQYQNQMDTWNALIKVNNNFFGIDENVSPNMETRIDIANQWQNFYYQKQQEEIRYDNLVRFMNNATNSTQKGYMSPNKENVYRCWNEYYNKKKEKYGTDYTLEDFFNKGIMGNMLMDTLIEEAEEREKEVFRQYSKQDFRNTMHSFHPDYDPYTGTTTTPHRSLNIDDLEISLPPHLAREEYAKRREEFINTIFRNKVSNFETKR